MRRVFVGLVCLLAASGSALPVWAEEGSADLAVTIAWGAGGTPHVRSGETATWELSVTNVGTATATAVEVVPGGSDQFGRFTSSCGQDFCYVGDLLPGESRTVTFSATACLIQTGNAPARRMWWVSGAAWSAADANSSNNTASLDVRITGSSTAPCFTA
jgi:hypothetical protein